MSLRGPCPAAEHGSAPAALVPPFLLQLPMGSFLGPPVSSWGSLAVHPGVTFQPHRSGAWWHVFGQTPVLERTGATALCSCNVHLQPSNNRHMAINP